MKILRGIALFLLLSAALALPVCAQEADCTGADFSAEGFSNPGRLCSVSLGRPPGQLELRPGRGPGYGLPVRRNRRAVHRI